MFLHPGMRVRAVLPMLILVLRSPVTVAQPKTPPLQGCVCASYIYAVQLLPPYALPGARQILRAYPIDAQITTSVLFY
jgi:hypothetical protein